ncbi:MULTISPECIES: hypothetical protein [unclassified Sinorhizobium]|uniref:hypothetical protein n=1 Tax=unclassified Sinorhizobium TaxID=2613772 RepID=UPI003523E709
MAAGGKPSTAVIAILAVLCLILFAWTYLGFVLPFRAAAAGRDMLDARLAGYRSGEVYEMLHYLRGHPDAAAIQHSLYLGPGLIFPAAVAALLFLLMQRVEPGGFFFGRPIPPGAVAVIFLLPVLYGLVDYAENVAGLLLYPPATASIGTIAFLSSMLPILVRLKFLLLVIIVIMLARFAMFRHLSRGGSDET